MRVVLMSHIGNSRQNHEDNAIVANSYLSEKHLADMAVERKAYFYEYELSTERRPTLLAVSDGMGGHSSGEVASRLSVKHLADNHDRIVKAGKAELVNEIVMLNRVVVNHGRKNPCYRGMGATICGAIARQGGLVGFNVGDSRMYRVFNGKIIQLSKDHTEGRRLLDLGLLSESEVEKFLKRKALYQYIGSIDDPVPQVFDVPPCDRGDVILICTDGLYDAISDEEICDMLKTYEPIEERGKKMLDFALKRNVGRGDNITFILIEF